METIPRIYDAKIINQALQICNAKTIRWKGKNNNSKKIYLEVGQNFTLQQNFYYTRKAIFLNNNLQYLKQ